MTLTKQVEEALRSSQADLREALAFSARAEKPYVSKHIAEMLLRIDSLIEVSDIFEKILEDYLLASFFASTIIRFSSFLFFLPKPALVSILTFSQ